MAGRVTQESIDVGLIPDDAVVRVTQESVDVGMVPDDAVVRVTMESIDVAIIDPTYVPTAVERAYVVWVG